MHWYLVHTKPKQEKYALENLQRQGYECYLPLLLSERIRQGILMVTDEPLFPRYLFIRLGQGGGEELGAGPLNKGSQQACDLWSRARQGS